MGIEPIPPRSQRGVHASTPRPPCGSPSWNRTNITGFKGRLTTFDRGMPDALSELRESNPRLRFVGPRPSHWTKLRSAPRGSNPHPPVPETGGFPSSLRAEISFRSNRPFPAGCSLPRGRKSRAHPSDVSCVPSARRRTASCTVRTPVRRDGDSGRSRDETARHS